MATQLPISPVDRPASEIDYKALSALAVAALIYSSVLALVILIVVLSALWTKPGRFRHPFAVIAFTDADRNRIVGGPRGCRSAAPRALELV